MAVLLAGLVRAFVFQTFWIPSSSMVPTLAVYDRIVVQKTFFSWHDVREGNIVVFRHPPLDQCPGPQQGDLVKRVIAQRAAGTRSGCRPARTVPAWLSHASRVSPSTAPTRPS